MKKFLSLSCLFFLVIIYCSAQDSLNMVRVGQWDPPGMPSNSSVTYNDCWGYTTPSGEEYAIIGNVDSVLVIDVTDPTNPTRIYGFYGGDRTTWRDFKTFGNYMYAVCDVNCSEGLHIFDMSALPGGNVTHVLSTTSFFDKAHNIYIDVPKAKLYAVGVAGATDVVVLDLSVDPANPSLMPNGNINFNLVPGVNPNNNYYVHDVYVRNDTAYCSHGYLGFWVWDLADLGNIDLLGEFDTGGYNHSSWTNDAGDYAYYAEEVPNGLPMGIMDLANLGSASSNIDTVKTFVDPISPGNSNPTPHNPFVKNDTMYISYYMDGIKAYDVTNPTNPVLIGYYDTYPDNGTSYPNGYDGCWGIYPFFNSGTIIASDDKYGLNVIEFDFPDPPCDGETMHFSGTIPTDTYFLANDLITADGTIDVSSAVFFQARNSVELQNGFETLDPNVDFEVEIGPCDNTSPPLVPNQAPDEK